MTTSSKIRTMPPGVRLLVQFLPLLVLPPIAVVAGSRLLSATGFGLPTWAVLLLAIVSLPLAATLKIQYGEYKKRRDAARLGAVLPPTVVSRLPGGWDLMKSMKGDVNEKMIGFRHFEWLAEYGSVCNFRIFFGDRIIASHPEYIKRVLATDFANYEKGPELRFQLQTLLGTGVFNSDGDMWKFHRAMTRPFFTKDRISHFDIFDRHSERAIQLIKARMAEGLPIDFQDLISRFTLDSATAFLFGLDVRSLHAALPYPPTSANAAAASASTHPSDAFTQAFGRAQWTTARRGRWGGAWPLGEFWRDKVQSDRDIVEEYVRPVVEEALRRKHEADGKGAGKAFGGEEDGATLLEHLVRQTDDPKIIIDETINILLAGRDTTASTLTSAVYMLAMHPDVCARLREEVLQTVGTERRPTYDDIRDMKYLRAFINETLRLYPPVPINVRYSVEGAVWPSPEPGGKPLYIPPHSRIIYSVFVMHRRKDLWGPDALEFDPDRFLDARLHTYLTPNPMIFLPFNAGPRICLGQQFAYNETSFMLIRLLQHFARFGLAQGEACPDKVPAAAWASHKGTNGADRVRVRSHLTMFVDGGLWVRMQEGDSHA